MALPCNRTTNGVTTVVFPSPWLLSFNREFCVSVGRWDLGDGLNTFTFICAIGPKNLTFFSIYDRLIDSSTQFRRGSNTHYPLPIIGIPVIKGGMTICQYKERKDPGILLNPTLQNMPGFPKRLLLIKHQTTLILSCAIQWKLEIVKLPQWWHVPLKPSSTKKTVSTFPTIPRRGFSTVSLNPKGKILPTNIPISISGYHLIWQFLFRVVVFLCWGTTC